jgi:hypothetical protein
MIENIYNNTINKVEPNSADYLNLSLFYGIISYYIYLLYLKNKKNNYPKIAYDYSCLGLITDSIDNPDISNDLLNKILKSLLNINSIDRSVLLYYIFEEKGDFKNNNDKISNSYEEFKCLERYYELKKDFNLDENQERDTTITIGNNTYNTTTAELRFVSWVYYSGLYNYLICNENLKYELLKDMASKKLLVGNTFIMYQFFLLDYESRHNIKNYNDGDDCDDDNCDSSESDDCDSSESDEESNEEKDEKEKVINEESNEKPDITDIDAMLDYYYVLGKFLDTAKKIVLDIF